jgi:hypothetical protein
MQYFSKFFSGEVLSVFNTKNIFKDLHRVRTITEGKSASFPALGKATAVITLPEPLFLEAIIPRSVKRVIAIDDLLISDVFIDDLEDAKLHFDVRSEYSNQLGIALSNKFDEKIARLGYLAARSRDHYRPQGRNRSEEHRSSHECSNTA